MGRPAEVSKEAVMNAVFDLMVQNRALTISAVREHVGKRGSNSTILQWMHECREEIRRKVLLLVHMKAGNAELIRDLIEQLVWRMVIKLEEDTRNAASAEILAMKIKEQSTNRSHLEAYVEKSARDSEREEALQLLLVEYQEVADRASAGEKLISQQASEIQRLRAELESKPKASSSEPVSP
ncbi:hypothetical protein C3942_16935 [Solimonas fluminis]|jgi:hypothetical protein|uniref:KfrA N-terminal DNA-binding domain-containing protein n=2 Tax=Solimonas fluminis TaxID=2086571 RepID=A0A2S5TCJ8_9GAMM|nr:hypothetical protein C3942_16935 [Solimonas fluminis]